MDSSDLTPAQAQELCRQVARQLRYLGRLRDRMTRLGFPRGDPLWIAVSRAFNATQELHVRAHYAGCTSGVGTAAKQQW